MSKTQNLLDGGAASLILRMPCRNSFNLCFDIFSSCSFLIIIRPPQVLLEFRFRHVQRTLSNVRKIHHLLLAQEKDGC